MGDLTIYYCPGCGRVGESSADLTRQGCEGRHVEYVPAAERDYWRDGWRITYIDVDACEYCSRCREPLALIEERDRYRQAFEDALLLLHGNEHWGPFGDCPRCKRNRQTILSGGDEDG